MSGKLKVKGNSTFLLCEWLGRDLMTIQSYLVMLATKLDTGTFPSLFESGVTEARLRSAQL